MKSILKVSLLTIAMLLIIHPCFFAQPENQGMPVKEPLCQKMGIPGLTEEQKTKIHKLRVANQKEMLPIKNELMEKKARLTTLTTAEKPDMEAVNKVIDEIGALKTKMMKKQAAHKQDIRSILTEEQRLLFDTRRCKPHGKKERNCMRNHEEMQE